MLSSDLDRFLMMPHSHQSVSDLAYSDFTASLALTSFAKIDIEEPARFGLIEASQVFESESQHKHVRHRRI